LTWVKYVDINIFVKDRPDRLARCPLRIARSRRQGGRPIKPGYRSTKVENDMQIQPYLFFDGRCEEAIAFYKQALGAEVGMLMRWKDSPDKSMCTPGNADKVMHSSVRIGEATVMMSDGRNTGNPKFEGFALSLDAKDEADAHRMFNALADGGQVTMPLSKTFFSSCFGMCADKFGVHWMVIVP
jgi:PhnB protein